MLNKYIAQCQRFARDQKQAHLDIGNLTDYINQARREVAMRAQCIRVVPPISGSIEGWSITNQGSGYSANTTATVTAPDFPSGKLPSPSGAQATATVVVSGGKITNVFSQFGGYGYFQPQITFVDGAGTGATATPIMSPLALVTTGREEYNFSDFDLSTFPGVKEIYYVRSASILYSNYRYSLPCYAFSIYQAYIRQYPFQYQYVPTFFSQFGQGASGSLFFYPYPSQNYQVELDCCCIPIDLEDDQSVEAIPDPWIDAVPYWSAKLIFEELQNLNASRYYEEQFNRRCLGYSNYARVGRAVNVYGRY